ncbi:MAG TPA: DVU3141 family protein [Polyangiaceae bacterium]|nr:DVU3141 family protein [Polyangiaceae bacterium]
MSSVAPVLARPWVLVSVCVVMIACGSTNSNVNAEEPSPILGDGTAEAASPAEAKVLERLDQLPVAEARPVDTLSVVADAPYAAASGKTCRRLTLTPLEPPKTSRTRLACKDGDRWAFVPSVFLVPTEQ